MSFNIYDIANAGIRANSQLLQTTSKNIANVNTEGYVRERTEFTTMIDNQVGRGETYRLLNEFAQKQLNRDTSSKAFFDQFVTEASRMDSLFSEESNSVSTSVNSFFNNIQESLNQPSSNVARSLVMTDAQNLIDQMDRLSGIVSEQKAVVNEQLEIFSEEANNLIQSISELNSQIVAVDGTDRESLSSSLYNERDKAIRDLSELIDIETLDGSNGEKQVYLGTGEALVMENGTFNLFSLTGDPDPSFQELKLDVNGGKAVPLEVDTGKLKGKIGGLLSFRDDILVPAHNQLGQMGLALADAFNQQNHLGMTANGEMGGDIFAIPSTNGLAYQANTGNASMTATVEAGFGSSLPASDFVISYTSPTTVEIQAVDNKGEPIGAVTTADVVGGVIDSSTITPAGGESFGLELNVSGTANVGDKFMVKLNSHASGNLELATNRPEDLALASPIRTANDINNTSDASISAGTVTDAGYFGSPVSLPNGSITISKTAEPDEYTVSDGVNTETFNGTPPLKNVLSAAGGNFVNYGFDFDIEGTPALGDTFTVEANEGGIDDNRNGLLLADIQNSNIVRRNVDGSADNNHQTVNQAYTGLVSDIGVVTGQAQTNGAAFTALAEQSEAWYESLSGVNLDEEAANLLRFQQSYAASAQVLATARSVFDTLLSAAR
ncbi:MULTISPECIES: flagellar hook-associated protein FlgK [Pseudoalteromonas]|uniref:flagellar hook-associated protein FlgK n=1 Tax=Pseudoalteromonas TaxID=53246 RepID=UPI0007826441|nr:MULTISPECIES: flagellar hook-associated protein FlgK [Gammaproteobacteria]MCF7517012.1 flagellar hook-associated protein FlgK [Pseudoalteromonas sp. L21]UJX24687.1 flagellar hook-associated protein FlgK [Pseudoalteromonas sp. CF6-2]|tara:strand:+ start:3728 stop:5725 length:1998 start_codon:yes stop_codon:yes gene_type:complete